ncbi:MAG: 30S ribosomal protein S15 [Oligoflexales bacterium]
MALNFEQKQDLIKKFAKSPTNTGAPEVQIALLTKRLEKLNDHFKAHEKDNHSRMGLLRLVGQRRRLLKFLQNSNPQSYKKLIEDLGIRK